MADYLKDKYNEIKKDYEDLTENIESRVLLENRVLQDCLNDQLQLQMEVSRLLNKTKYYKEVCQIEIDKVYAKGYKGVVTDSYKDFSSTEAKQIAMADDDYIYHRKLLNKFQNLYNELNELADVVETRKYTLKTLTDSMISGINKTVI